MDARLVCLLLLALPGLQSAHRLFHRRRRLSSFLPVAHFQRTARAERGRDAAPRAAPPLTFALTGCLPCGNLPHRCPQCVLNVAAPQRKIGRSGDESTRSAGPVCGLGERRLEEKGLWTMSFATAVAPEVENARDAPNAPADRQALSLVKPYQGMVAWPTVLLAAGIVATFALVTTLAVEGTIPLWLGLILNMLILYADQTPLHEACHGNIAGKDSRWLWLNHLVGYVCGVILLHEYKAFRYMHL